MRRAFFALLLLAIVGAAAWTLWNWNDTVGDAADPWRAVPAQAAVIIEVPDAWAAWDRFTHADPLWRELAVHPGARELSAWMAHLQAGAEKDAALRSALSGSPIIVALMRNGSQGTGWIAVSALYGDVADEAVGDLLGIAANERVKLMNGQVVDVRPVPSLPSLSFAWRKGLWILGSSATMVDEALMQEDAGIPITADPLFEQARATLGEGPQAHVLLHTARITGLLLDAWEAERLERLDLPEGWLALDMNTRSGEWLLSGLLVPAGSHPVLTSISEQGAGAWNIGRLLPEKVVQWEVRHVEDAVKQLAASPAPDDVNAVIEILPEWAYGAVGVATACDSVGGPGMRWLVIGTGDPEGARLELERPCALAPCDTLGHRGARITQLQEMRPYEQLMGRYAVLPQQAWWVVLGDHVVMSDDPNALRMSIDTWNDGESLAEDERANACFQRMSDDAAFTWWCDPARGGALFREGLKAGTDSAFAAWMPVLGLSSGLSLQLSPAAHGMTHVSVLLLHAPSDSSIKVNAPRGALWSCTLDAPVRRVPDVLINHVNQTRELLVQDSLHRIHLISAAGQRLWSRALDGPIMGDVHQVDRFKNGKLQMLFNTAGAVYMIDRNGKDVGGYPVNLKQKAATPLAVFDYDKDRTYRILVGLEDGRIANFTGEGGNTEGWAMPKLAAPAVASVYHVRIRNKDHLLTIDREGAIRLFDRKGDARDRVSAEAKGVAHVHAVNPGPDIGSTRVAWSNEAGALFETALNGTTRTVLEGPLTLLAADDLDGDGAVEAVFSRNDSVRLKVGSTLTVLRSMQQPAARSTRLRNGDLCHTLASMPTEQAWVYNEQGMPLTDQPLQGILPPVVSDLDRDGTLEAITVTRDLRLIAHRLAAP